jgi:hypothetical protein
MRSAFVIFLAIAVSASAQEDKPVEQTKKNITVLKGLPSSQLIPVMAFMANSLGVSCGHCHGEQWESDEKPAKDVARRMLRMTRTINEHGFDSKVVVTCNTCHRGHLLPAATPQIDNAGWNQQPPAPAPTLPMADVIVERYLKALGDPGDRLASRISTGTVTRANGRTAPVSKSFELYQDASKGDIKTELPYPPDANRMVRRWFTDAANIRDWASGLRTAGTAKVAGHDAYVVDAGEATKLYFDTKTSLLLRIYRETQTPLGLLPERYDFADYRPVDGVAVPFEMQWSRGDYQVTHRFTRVEHRPAASSSSTP